MSYGGLARRGFALPNFLSRGSKGGKSPNSTEGTLIKAAEKLLRKYLASQSFDFTTPRVERSRAKKYRERITPNRTKENPFAQGGLGVEVREGSRKGAF